MSSKKRIYISGPITDNPDYKEDFARAEKWLWDNGYVPISPAKVNGEIPLEAEFTHSDYMDVCMPILHKCDGIYLLKGWQDSKGALIELRNILIELDNPFNDDRKEYLILTE